MFAFFLLNLVIVMTSNVSVTGNENIQAKDQLATLSFINLTI